MRLALLGLLALGLGCATRPRDASLHGTAAAGVAPGLPDLPPPPIAAPPAQGSGAPTAGAPASVAAAPLVSPPPSGGASEAISLLLDDEGGPKSPSAPAGNAAAEVPLAVIPAGAAPVPDAAKAPRDDLLATVECLTCNGSGRLAGLGTCLTCGGGGRCYPGQKPYPPWEAHSAAGRFFGMLYECICCPDPCYEPTWVPEANAAFFVDHARPQTMSRFRWDHFENMRFPDRAEYFIPEASLNRSGSRAGTGPAPPKLRFTHLKNKPFLRGFPAVDMDNLYMYTEAATKRSAFFLEMSYRSLSVEPQSPFRAGQVDTFRHAAGFGDMNLGTKSLLLDCELMQVSFQFKTFLPVGESSEGLGTGHVSLEPSLLLALKLGPETYLQGQLAEWVPIGGDEDYQGAILHYHASLNHVLYRFAPEVPLIGTFELDGWSFQDGLFTAPFRGPVNASGDSYISLGPGLRLSICKAVDFGAAFAVPVSQFGWGEPTVRTELRILY